jgi:hypothetical protein
MQHGVVQDVMTVGQLRRVLEDVPDQTVVVLSRDKEGNLLTPLSEVRVNRRFQEYPAIELHPM